MFATLIEASSHHITHTTKQKHVLNNGNDVKKYYRLEKTHAIKKHKHTHAATHGNNDNNTGQARGGQHTCSNQHSEKPDAHEDPGNKTNPKDERLTPAGLHAHTTSYCKDHLHANNNMQYPMHQHRHTRHHHITSHHTIPAIPQFMATRAYRGKAITTT